MFPGYTYIQTASFNCIIITRCNIPGIVYWNISLKSFVGSISVFCMYLTLVCSLYWLSHKIWLINLYASHRIWLFDCLVCLSYIRFELIDLLHIGLDFLIELYAWDWLECFTYSLIVWLICMLESHKIGWLFDWLSCMLRLSHIRLYVFDSGV